ncbi:MAG TPA: ATP-dependent Clp protease adaptor ClpS [Thermoanaerobaculia bacterium]|nr:ATP-dependent Clp protease adaptor ClpS [Thermoanaerobaculia bacterium]
MRGLLATLAPHPALRATLSRKRERGRMGHDEMPAHPPDVLLSMAPPDSQYEESAVAESAEKVEEPPLFKVLLHNDDFTTMEFVVWVLESVFGMPEQAAIQIMLNVHVKGVGVAGVYTYEIAEMKVSRTTELAREQEYPLLCTMERA